MRQRTIDSVFGLSSCLAGLAAIPIGLALVPAIGDLGAVVTGMIWSAIALFTGIDVLGSNSFRARVLGVFGLVVGGVSLWAFGIALAFGSSLMSALQIPG